MKFNSQLYSSSHSIRESAKNPAKIKNRQINLQHQFDRSSPDQDSNTIYKTGIPPKLKYYDEEATRNNKLDVKQRLTANVSSPKDNQLLSKENIGTTIERNEKIEEIMKSKGLREKYGHLLPNQHKLPIGFQHQHLLKKMQCIDRTISFLMSNRSNKSVFFEDLRRNIEESISVTVKLSHLQQILFLNQNYYNLKWEKNQKIKKYDILVTCKPNTHAEAKMTQMRTAIVTYLKIKQSQFINQNALTKIDETRWHPNFSFQKIVIPLKPLPVHPQHSNAQIRNLDDYQIERIKNPELKKLFTIKKQQSEVKSISSCDVANMMFSGVSSKKIKDMILQAVKQKQQKIQQIKIAKEENKVDNKTMIMILDEIHMVYISKGVSNIYKSTLIEILQKRLRLDNNIIRNYFQLLINHKGLKQIEILKEVLSSQKLKIVQINKSKLKMAKQYVEHCENWQI